MERAGELTCSLILAAFLVGCAGGAPTPITTEEPASAEPIRPGDQVGGFLVTRRADDEDIIYVSMVHCGYDESTLTESCDLPVGSKVNLAPAIFDDDPNDSLDLDAIWAAHTSEMTIEGRPVDLEAFGPIDVPFINSRLRHWNVVIVGGQPGTLHAHAVAVLEGETYEFNFVLTFYEK
jgi:hypothetical protein